MKSTNLQPIEKIEPADFGCVERWVIWTLPAVLGSVLGVAVGPLSGFDLLNLRWYAGWVVLSGNESINGSAAGLLTMPWLNDGIVALLLGADIWWLAPAVLGMAHGLLVPIAYRCVRASAPRLSRAGSVALASTGVMSPLVLMHVGRETGHLLAALVLGLSVNRFLSQPDDGFRIGMLLGVAPLIKVSVVLPALVLGTSFFLGLRGVQKIRFMSGSAGAFWFGSLFLTLWVQLEGDGLAFLPTIFGQGVSVKVVVLASATIAFVSWIAFFHDFNLRPWRLAEYFRKLNPIMLLAVTFLVTVFVRRNGLTDPRFRPPTLTGLLQQMLMTGNLRVPTELSDWEILYLDNSRMIMLFFMVGCILLAINRGSTDAEQRMLLTALAIFSSIIMVQASMGYVRYSSPSLALIPIAIGCVVGLNRGRRIWNEILVVSVALIILLPVADVSTWFKAPGIKTYSAYSSLISEDEKLLVNRLLPEGSTAFIFGTGTSSVAPAVGRTDVAWFFRPQRPSEVAVSEANLFYDLSDTRDLDKFTTRGWVLDPCQALRFENISYGWCALKADPQAEPG